MKTIHFHADLLPDGRSTVSLSGPRELLIQSLAHLMQESSNAVAPLLISAVITWAHRNNVNLNDLPLAAEKLANLPNLPKFEA